jgi:hypothetical protein
MLVLPVRPFKTAADFMAIAACPTLVMTLVGSLVLLLLEASYSGPWLGSMRWTLCWFTFAIVLVARIAITLTRGLAIMYGAALALATSAFLAFHFGFVLPVWLLLGLVWWASDRITWDCTLIDENVDSSGSGLMQAGRMDNIAKPKSNLVKAIGPLKEPPAPPPKPAGSLTQLEKLKAAQKKKTPARPAKKQKMHAPGLWVLYFSLAAIPLFGFGEILLPAREPGARRFAFVLLIVYLVSGATLLLLTSFLGLRRYLRQRFIQMPGSIAFHWVSRGAWLIAAIIFLAIVLPRPVTSYSLDRLVNEPIQDGANGKQPDDSSSQSGSKAGGPDAKNQPSPPQASKSSPPSSLFADKEIIRLPGWSSWFSAFFALAVGAVIIVRFWPEIAAAFRSLLDGLRRPKKAPRSGLFRRRAVLEPSAPVTFTNPFDSGFAAKIGLDELVRYSFDALQAWSALRGSLPESNETPVEFAERLSRREPAMTQEILLLSRYYCLLAYGGTPPPQELEPVLRKLWRFMTFGPAVQPRQDQWGS